MIGDRWGVTDEEVARHYPCDDVVAAPVWRAWRGVTVHATRREVWPWVTQIRLGPYSYDWIDNLGHRSPQELRDMPDPVPGQHFTTAGGRPTGRIVSVEQRGDPRTDLHQPPTRSGVSASMPTAVGGDRAAG